MKVNSAFLWVEVCGGDEWSLRSDAAFDHMTSLATDDYASAFTVAEVGEMLTQMVEAVGFNWTLEVHKLDGRENEWCILMRSRGRLLGDGVFSGREAAARAKMLIYLLENKLIPLFS